MQYYIFTGHRLARRTASFEYEWLVYGEWKEDDKRTLALKDAMNDYGDYSLMDQDQITPEMAEELIQNGTIVLHGNIGYGTSYGESTTIKLSEWKKPNLAK